MVVVVVVVVAPTGPGAKAWLRAGRAAPTPTPRQAMDSPAAAILRRIPLSVAIFSVFIWEILAGQLVRYVHCFPAAGVPSVAWVTQ